MTTVKRMVRRAGLVVAACLLAAVANPLTGPGSTQTADVAVAAGTTTTYQPVQPCRLVDTRTSEGVERIDSRTIRVSLDACGLPPSPRAVALTTTIVNTPTTGYLVAYPSGAARPEAATLTWQPGATRGNAAIVGAGAGGAVDVFRSDGFAAGALTVDVVGAFVEASTATSGRFVPDQTGNRLVDTRTGAAMGAGETITVPLPAGVPTDASALAITITATNTSGRGFFTAHPAGTERPQAATLNVDRAGQFRSGATIVPVTELGFDLYSESGAHVIVDMTGWFTGESAAPATDGLFVPVVPTRLADTRLEPRPIHRGGTIGVPLPDGLTDGIQAGAPAAVALSLAMIDPDVRGYVTAHPSRAPRGEVASGYALHGEVAAQFALTATSEAGVAVYSSQGTELTADLLGWFTGENTPISTAAPENPVPPQRVLAIGDSSMAGVDRTSANGALQGAFFDFRARSCRRLVRTSCNGREGPVPPPTALETLRSVPEDAYDVLVMMTGYNDTMPLFAWHVPQIIHEARVKGIRRIVWLTMAREYRHDKGGADAFQVYERHNQVIRANAAAHDFMIAPEWSHIIRQVPWWTYPDGIHLARAGGYGAADLISRAVAHVTGQRCPLPEVPGGPNDGVCPEPGSRPPVDVGRLYGV